MRWNYKFSDRITNFVHFIGLYNIKQQTNKQTYKLVAVRCSNKNEHTTYTKTSNYVHLEVESLLIKRASYSLRTLHF